MNTCIMIKKLIIHLTLDEGASRLDQIINNHNMVTRDMAFLEPNYPLVTFAYLRTYDLPLREFRQL